MKKILIIAGSCSNGGAGLQADIKACAHFCCYSATAVTALTAENTDKIKSIVSLDPSFVADQLEMLSAEFSFDAVKIGMLFNEPIMDVVQGFLEKNSAPVVLDPVCVSKMGHKLIKDSAIERLKELMKFAAVTPLADPLVIIGAGCTFSSSLACLLARGQSLESAIQQAKEYIYNAIINGIDTNLGVRKLLNHGVKF